jgi:hypothetical protein
MQFSNNIRSFENLEKIEGIFSEKKSNQVQMKTAYIPDTSSYNVYKPIVNNVSHSHTVLKEDETVEKSITKAIDQAYETLGKNKTKQILKDMIKKIEEE